MAKEPRTKAAFYIGQNCTSNPVTSQILSPGHFTVIYSVVYGFNGRLLPAFMAAVVDFNSGNMALTPNLNNFRVRMTVSLNLLSHSVEPTACEMDGNKSMIILRYYICFKL